MDAMRALLSPGFYGDITGGPLPHHFFYSRPLDKAISGPFTDESEIVGSIAKNLRSIQTKSKRYHYKADFYEHHLGQVFRGHQPVFSHSDLYRKNILVRRLETETETHAADEPGVRSTSYGVALVD